MVQVTALAFETGVEKPTDRELLTLQKAVEAMYPRYAAPADEVRRAFTAIGHTFFWTPGLAKRYVHEFVTDANEWLVMRQLEPISGNAFMCATIAFSEIPFQLGDRSAGIPLAVGLNKFSGRKYSNVWREVLKGRPLLAPIIPPQLRRVASYDAPQPRVYRQGVDGAMREVREDWRG